ncbi:LacI family transcription regulator [Brevibacterium casei S18]|uniref:LacI family transcription regulator n=1 Tax=Brevibacterium casei S18 TaxID=1229781 RepID=K9ANC0_9MICO|nr:LacI family transcription regulator [Brevibacterium casei S18]
MAQVSPSTVSHTLSGKRSISEATRSRVTAAIKKLGYHPNPQARLMKTRPADLVGLILRPDLGEPDNLIAHETFSRLLGAAAIKAVQMGVGLVQLPVVSDDILKTLPVNGFIVAHPNKNDEVLTALEEQHAPLVCIDADAAREHDFPLVEIDYRAGIDQLLEGIQLPAGSEIWLIISEETNAWTRAAKGAARQRALQSSARLVIRETTGYLPAMKASDLVESMFSEASAPPSLIAYGRSDLTEPILKAMQKRNLSAPADIQLAALTDTVHTKTSTPKVTALDLNHEAAAEAAIEQMLRVLHEPTAMPEPIVVETSQHFRDSTLGGQ